MQKQIFIASLFFFLIAGKPLSFVERNKNDSVSIIMLMCQKIYYSSFFSPLEGAERPKRTSCFRRETRKGPRASDAKLGKDLVLPTRNSERTAYSRGAIRVCEPSGTLDRCQAHLIILFLKLVFLTDFF